MISTWQAWLSAIVCFMANYSACYFQAKDERNLDWEVSYITYEGHGFL